MYMIYFFAFFAAAVAAANYFRVTLTKVIPILFCTLSLFLYGLAFIGHLSRIDDILYIALIGSAAYFIKQKKAGENPFLPLKDGFFWGVLVLSVIIFLAVQYRQVLEWDAYNFWAADVKYLFFTDGFAAKNCNAAPNFGDYPPAVQLILWWFMHLFGGQWREGILFGGYIVLGASFLFHLADSLPQNGSVPKFLSALFLGAIMLLLPGVSDTSWYRALYMDPVMGLTFGTLLCVIVDNKKEPSAFSKISILILLAFLTLIKSICFLWAIFAILFFFIWDNKTKANLLFSAAAIGVVATAYGSWTIFCKVMERTTYLTERISTSAITQIQALFNGTFGEDPLNVGLCKSFFSAFFSQPMHRQWTPFIDFTPTLFLILLAVLFFILFKAGILSPKDYIKISIYAVFVTVFTYAMLLTGHLTIFIEETAYLEPIKMIEQMTRYGSPVTIGFLMLATRFAADPWKTKEKPGRTGAHKKVIPEISIMASARRDW